MHKGESASVVWASRSDCGVARSNPSGLSRSVQASPTPPQDRATSRNARSQYPAIGASSRGVASVRLPILREAAVTGGLYAKFGGCEAVVRHAAGRARWGIAGGRL